MKTSPEQLIDEIAPDLNTFLRSGNLYNLTSFTKKIEPNLNINDIRKLLRIHFILTNCEDNNDIGVIDFVEHLSERVRRIKTIIKRETEELIGEVKGRIRWEDTLTRRLNRNPKDNTLFICDRGERDYDIPENLVLKRLLQIIHSIIYDDLSLAFENEYDWLKQWSKGPGLKNTLTNIFFRNVYLRRIDLINVRVTERMIYKASCSRLPLYREAASLLSRYNRLMNYDLDDAEAKDLLKNTFIQPEATSVLFELYWVIKIIKQFDPRAVTFELLEPGSKVVAEWHDSEYRYRVFHDSTGSFQFSENTEGLNDSLVDQDNYFGRELKVLRELEKMVGTSQNLWGGRPDIIVEKYDKANQLESVFIGEVKYTEDTSYAIQGLKELMEYMALIRADGTYFETYENLFANFQNIKGCLFVDGLSESIQGQDKIQIVRYGDTEAISV